MNAEEKFGHWYDTANYDLETASAMYKTGRWLYVAFLCQQSIEKLCKGLYTLYINDEVPRVHNIRYIVNQFSHHLSAPITDDQNHLFDRLTAFYMEGRYPEYKQKLSELLDKSEAKELLQQTQEMFSWLLTQKP